ncbi:MAG: N-acetylmuramoyl-L-alanine amidase, partial [Bacteroidota bacterium]
MRSRHVLFCLFLCFSLVAQSPKRELRGVWVATVQNIDWPSARNYNAYTQQKEFIDLLDSHQKTGINALFVQVRTAADAFYAKGEEPWSAYLSGIQGQAPKPSYDPLAFMIEESHARGMEFHAWLNMNRGSMSTKNILSANNIVRLHPEWMVVYNNQHLFNFGIPAVRQYITKIVKNIVQ